MRTGEKPPNVVLLGGPSSISETQRIRWVDIAEGQFKLCSGNRYEHFVSTEETAEVGNRRLHVFRWSECTKVAE